MGFLWSLEPARVNWAWFMLELRHTYEQNVHGQTTTFVISQRPHKERTIHCYFLQGSEPDIQPESTQADIPKTDEDPKEDGAETGEEPPQATTPPASSDLPNGNTEAENDEVTIDDLPPKLTSLSEVRG